jgi:hypothetical protein
MMRSCRNCKHGIDGDHCQIRETIDRKGSHGLCSYDFWEPVVEMECDTCKHLEDDGCQKDSYACGPHLLWEPKETTTDNQKEGSMNNPFRHLNFVGECISEFTPTHTLKHVGITTALTLLGGPTGTVMGVLYCVGDTVGKTREIRKEDIDKVFSLLPAKTKEVLMKKFGKK